jgi:hypothetical protein
MSDNLQSFHQKKGKNDLLRLILTRLENNSCSHRATAHEREQP